MTILGPEHAPASVAACRRPGFARGLGSSWPRRGGGLPDSAGVRGPARGGYSGDGKTENDGRNVFLLPRNAGKPGSVCGALTLLQTATGTQRTHGGGCERVRPGGGHGATWGGGAVNRQWTPSARGDKAEGRAWEAREDQKGPMGICGSIRSPSLSSSHQPGLIGRGRGGGHTVGQHLPTQPPARHLPCIRIESPGRGCD